MQRRRTRTVRYAACKVPDGVPGATSKVGRKADRAGGIQYPSGKRKRRGKFRETDFLILWRVLCTYNANVFFHRIQHELTFLARNALFDGNSLEGVSAVEVSCHPVERFWISPLLDQG